MFDTKVAVIIRSNLLTWQKLNVTAFLATGVAGAKATLGSIASRPMASQAWRTSAVRKCSSMPTSFTDHLDRVGRILRRRRAWRGSHHATVLPSRSRYRRPGLPCCASSTSTTFGMVSSTLKGASGPPRPVRIQPGAISTRARGSPA